MADLSKEYATALFSLASEKSLLEEIKTELDIIKAQIEEESDYLMILRSPALPLSVRLGLIDESFGSFNEFTVSFLKLLCENAHIELLPECIDEFMALYKELLGRSVAKIYYVREPSSEQKTRLEEKLEKISGKKIDAIYLEDSSLIGGIKIELEDKIIDGSVSARLTNIKGVIGK